MTRWPPSSPRSALSTSSTRPNRAPSRSWWTTSTSACSAASASTPPRPASCMCSRFTTPVLCCSDKRSSLAMTVHERPYGRYFEEFEVGDVYRHWPGKTITESDDHLFCLLTMNHHPLHIDNWYAEQSQFGKNVVAGPVVYSIVFGMSIPDVSGKAIANLETEQLLHRAPTFHGDTIYAESKVLDKVESKSKADRGIVTVETRGFNQRGEEVCYYRRKVLIPK